MQRKNQKLKPQLTISIPNSEKKNNQSTINEEECYIKPIYSMKNGRKPLPKFVFNQEQLYGQFVPEKKYKKIEKDKDILMNSLGALKIGAISAIVQKQQEIDLLRSQFDWEEIKKLEDQIQELHRERTQLQESIQQLEERLASERQSYMRLLEEKDRVIEQLYIELGSNQIEIEKLEKYQQIKEKKIKIMQEQNFCLFQQLEEEKILHLNQNHEALLQKQQFISNQQFSREQEQRQIDSAIQDQTAAIENQYKQQVQQLTLFYEKRISELRQIYERELELWPQQSKNRGNLIQQEMENAPSLRQTYLAPHQLSHELNLKKLSDCYSIAKRDTRFEGESLYTIDRDGVESNFKFVKRALKTPPPPTNTTSSLKPEQQQLKIMVTNQKAILETEQSQKDALNLSPKHSLTDLVIGVVTGGVFGFFISKLLK